MFEATASETFPAIEPYMAARGYAPGRPYLGKPPGAELPAIREAAPDVRGVITVSGRPDGVATCDLITLPYPVRFGLWRAADSPAPFLWITNRMLVVQWTDEDGATRTLLWEASDHERGEYTPYFENLKAKAGPAGRFLSKAHGTVLGHLQALGIDPNAVDYIAFDHLHTQDVRRLIGTRDSEGWFPNAKLITQVHEWETIRHLHPLQAPWYQPQTYEELRPESLLFVDGDVLVGPGVALLFTPGHTAGNMSLVLNTDSGLWVSSENGIAAESWTPQASRIRGVRSWCGEFGQEVVLNANVLEFTAWQYDSMVAEALVADVTPGGDFRQCFPSSELTAHPLAPMAGPTYVHGSITHGAIRPTPVGARA